jgi:hypothetical protein
MPRWPNGKAQPWKGCFLTDIQVQFLVWAYFFAGLRTQILTKEFKSQKVLINYEKSVDL